jgi:hypothetical protein
VFSVLVSRNQEFLFVGGLDTLVGLRVGTFRTRGGNEVTFRIKHNTIISRFDLSSQNE